MKEAKDNYCIETSKRFLNFWFSQLVVSEVRKIDGSVVDDRDGYKSGTFAQCLETIGDKSCKKDLT